MSFSPLHDYETKAHTSPHQGCQVLVRIPKLEGLKMRFETLPPWSYPHWQGPFGSCSNQKNTQPTALVTCEHPGPQGRNTDFSVNYEKATPKSRTSREYFLRGRETCLDVGVQASNAVIHIWPAGGNISSAMTNHKHYCRKHLIGQGIGLV